jgi:hypothetical protein
MEPRKWADAKESSECKGRGLFEVQSDVPCLSISVIVLELTHLCRDFGCRSSWGLSADVVNLVTAGRALR